MKEVKDPEIVLFGKKIALPEHGGAVPAGEDSYGDSGGGNHKGSNCGFASDCSVDANKLSTVEESEPENEDDKDADKHQPDKIGVIMENHRSKPEEKEQCLIAEGLRNLEAVSISDDSPETPSMDEDCTAKQSSDTENDQGDSSNSQPKTLKKPDKILPCPRCNSMDTKFCYYNNYNVNQPRHFCRSCQRYWTAGGTMRNVPVGSGRRKNKNSAANGHPMSISEALQAARMDAPNGFHSPNFKPDGGTLLTYGPELPLRDSMASVLNLTDNKVLNGCPNGFYKRDPLTSVCEKVAGNGCIGLSGSSSVTTSTNSEGQGVQKGEKEPVLQHMNSYPSPFPYLPGVPWPFPWNSAVPMPAICPSGYPVPVYPAPLWNWSMSYPLLAPVSPAACEKLSDSSSNPSSLGKHSREGQELQEPKISEGSILVPKTLRIDDPEEAAKSSIWTTLGIKYDSNSRGGLFKAFQQKTDEKCFPPATSPVLQANPAALSRSVAFQETA